MKNMPEDSPEFKRKRKKIEETVLKEIDVIEAILKQFTSDLKDLSGKKRLSTKFNKVTDEPLLRPFSLGLSKVEHNFIISEHKSAFSNPVIAVITLHNLEYSLESKGMLNININVTDSAIMPAITKLIDKYKTKIEDSVKIKTNITL
jgi:hypothetical protein